MRGHGVEGAYPRLARWAVDVVTGPLGGRPAPSGPGSVVDYHPEEPSAFYSINDGALCARLFVDLYAHVEETALGERATEILDHGAVLPTEAGGWHYRDPPRASHLSIDTHHDGCIVESVQRTM